MVKMLSTDVIFGKCIARCGVIEFQKRGAPHLHLMIWITDFDATPENIDNIICAEIPRDPSASKREEEFTKEDKEAQRYHDTVKKWNLDRVIMDAVKRVNASRTSPRNFNPLLRLAMTPSRNIVKGANKMVAMLRSSTSTAHSMFLTMDG